MNLSHYSDHDEVAPYAVAQDSPSPVGKPRGLWVSVDGPDDWAEWNRVEQFRDIGAQHRHRVTLAPSSTVLHLGTLDALLEFSEAYRAPHPWRDGGTGVTTIDWQRVAERHQGVIIAPYQWPARLNLMWYYPWDCASGCIWDPAAIDSVARVEVAA